MKVNNLYGLNQIHARIFTFKTNSNNTYIQTVDANNTSTNFMCLQQGFHITLLEANIAHGPLL